MAELEDLNPEEMEEYRRYLSQAKQEARSGNLEASLQLFQQALKIHFSEKLTANIKKLEEALASLAVEEEEDNFVDVCQSGLMLYEEMHDKLFDYQREGVAFLYKLYQERRKGGILADDMGLGKTIQIIAFLSGMFDAELIRSVLLILPVSLLKNWVKEFAEWTPGLRVKVFHGTNKAERNSYLERIQRRTGILLTTYQMLLNNWQQLSSFGGKEFVWDYIILDEAHKIKTPSAKTTKSVHAIPSKNRILLTGTPVQNNLKELWALFNFACQGSLLGTVKTFQMEYENPITRARAKDATPSEKALGLKISENLMSIIKPYFLRRTKDELQKKKELELPNHLPENQGKDVAPVMPSLPRKNEFIVWVFLAPVQEEIYRNFISLDHIKELLLSKKSPLAELNILKKVCDHPRLLSNRACRQLGLEASNYSEEEVGEDEPSQLLDMNRNIEHVSDEMLIQESGKLTFLVALLERLQYEGHKTLVFSLSRKILDIIERVLTQRGFKLMRIDGTVTQLAEREKRIGMFQKGADYSVFLLTTQVGGIGLTLTAASRVVIFDPSWNPATDAQAVDRAYRIGQKENVIIYRLITCGTVEEKIYRRQVFKDSLIRQSTGDKKNPYRYFTMQELKELFILEDTRSSATQLQLQSLHATQRKTDTELDEHIAYLHALDIFGISDHDLIYTRETAHDDEAENEEVHRYIEQRVQKAQEMVQLESQLNDQHMRNIGNMTEGAWLRDKDSSTQPKTRPSKSSPGVTLGPSTSERTTPTIRESPTPSTKKSPTPPPSPVVNPPVFSRPVITNEVTDLVSNDDNDAVSDMVNLSSKMTSLVVEDMDDEQMLQIISNTEDALPSEEKEHQFPSFQACDLNPGTTLVSPFQTHSASIKEDYSPESSAISELPAKDTDDEQMVSHTTNADVLHSKNEECQPTRLQTDDQNKSLNVVSSLPQATSSSIEGNVNSESNRISCDPSPEARSELKDVQMKLLQESVAYLSDDGMQRSETNMSLDVLPITHGDACEINEVDGVAQHQALVSKTTESITLQKPGARETEQFKSPDISSHCQQMRNIINTTEGSWLRDTDSPTQPKTKPPKSLPGDTLGPSTSERTTPTIGESPTPSTKKSPTPPPSPVVNPPVFSRPVITNEVIDLVSNDDNDAVSDMVNLSSKMTSLVVEDMDDEQMLQIISNTEDALPSEEKEHQFPSFQACDLNPGTTLVSPFQTHSASIKEDYSPESSAISELPAKDTDDEQMVSHTTNADVLHSKNEECQPTRLQTDDQNKSLNVVSSLPQATSSSIEGNVNSESNRISCDPSPEARSELKDVQMKLLQESVAYLSDDGMQRSETNMSLDVLPITHGDACEINEVDGVAQHQALVSKTTESITLQKPGARETEQFKSPDISSHCQQMRNIINTTEGAWLRDTDSSTQPKTKPPKSLPGDTLGPSTSERTTPTIGESPTPSTKKSPTPPPSPVVNPPVFSRPVITNEVIDLVSNDDNDAVSDMVNLSSKMTSLVVEDMDDEQMLQIISNTEDALPSEEKEHQFPSFQACDLNPGTTLVSPFQTHSASIKEDYSPESSAISELPAKDTDDEQMVSHTTNADVLHSKNEECQPTRLQTDDQNKSLNVVSSLPQATSSSIEGNVNSESNRISCDPSPEARSELKDVQMKLLQESVAYLSDDGMQRSETNMSLDVLPITHGDACEINEVDGVAQHQALVSKTTESITLQKPGARETEQFKSPDISSHCQQMRNIINTTEGAWLRDTDSSTQPKTKPPKSLPGDTLGPSTSERTTPTIGESPTPSTKKSPTPPPSPVVNPPVFSRPVITNEVIDLVSNDDNDAVSDMVNLSSKMTSLVVEDMDDEQMLQIISNTEDALPSEEKEHQFPSFQACDLNPGTTLVSPFQTHSASIKEDYSPESSAISELPAKDTDDEQMVSHTTNADVLHSKNEECQPTRLQTDDQNKSLNVVSSLPQATSSSIEGNVNSESNRISCDPSPEARSELKDVQMKLLQESVAYLSDDGMQRSETNMSLDVLPITHGDACEINEVDGVAQHQALVSKTTESITLQKPGARETEQFKSPDISSHCQQMRNIINTTEGAWLRDTDSSTQPKTKPPKSLPGDTLGPSTSERTSPTIGESPTPSTKKSPTPPPSPVVNPPVFSRPVITNEVTDLVSNDDNDAVSDMVNLSSKMTSLVVEDMDDEQMLQIISNTEDALPSEEKEHQFPSFQARDLNPGTTLVSPFQTHSASIKEDYSPESSAISELPAKDTDDEQMVSHTTNADVLHSKNEECQPTRLQTDDQNKSLNVVSSLPQATSSSIEGNVNSESNRISCDPSPEARSELKDVQMKLLQESVAYLSDDGMQRSETNMSLDVLPITHGDACEINEVDGVAQHQALVSKTTESITLQKPGARETEQFKSPDISSHCQQMRNIINTTEGAWLRDTDSSTQPKTKPPKSLPGDTLGPSTSERTTPTIGESPTPSTKKSPTPPPSPVVNPPVFSRPVITNEVTDLVSNDDNDAVSDMVNLSSKMTSLVVEDMDDEQMLQIISNTEDALPSEEKEHQFPSFQACDLNPGTTLVSPFQTHSASIKEDYSPESSAISELPAKDTDDEQMVSHTTNADVLHSKNEECQPTRLQTDDQNKSLNVVSSLPQATSSSIEGNVNSESNRISCDPSPEARSELKDVQMKLLQESVAYLSDDGMHRSETNMSLDVLPITHGDACEINEVDGVAQHQALVSKTTESITLQKPGARETEQFKSPDISSHCQQMRNIINTTEGAWLRDTDSSTQPKTKPPKSLPGDTLGPSTSERTSPTIGESPTPSTKKSPTPPPSPVVNPPVFSRPVITNEVIDLVSNDDNDAVSDMVNLSSKMTSLVVEDMDDEQMLQIISNTEDALPSEEKEHQLPSFQACDLNPGTTLVSPFQTHSASIKEDYSPESSAISELPAKDTDDEQMVSHTTNADVLHSKNEECQPTRLQTDDQNKSLNVVSSLPQATSSSIEGNVNSESNRISCDPSPEARSELKDVQMKLLQESVAYLSDDGMQRSETNMSLDVLPITHGDACEINEVDGVAQHQALVSKTTESITLQKPGARETEQFKSPDISSHCQQMRNIINTTEGAWLRDTDSPTQPKTKPPKSLPGDTLGPSTSERTTPTIGESPTPSTKKSPTPPPSPVVNPPVFSRPVITNEVTDLVSNDDNDAVSDTVNLSSKMTSLVVEDMDDEQMLQIISNTEDALPSEEKEHQFPSFQACDLNPGTTLVSPFQTHSASIKEDYSPESSAISELPAKDTDDEQMVSHTTNADVLHSKNEECQPTRLQTDDQNKSLNVVSSLPQATSSSIEGNVNSESNRISCDPSPEARSELKDVQMKLLQESVAYLSDDGMQRSETNMSLDVLPITHGDACEINEVDGVAQHQALVSKTTESITLQKPGARETEQFKSPDISSHCQQMRNIINTTEGAWLRDTDSSTQPKTKPPKSLPGDTLGPSTSERTSPTIGESPTPSTKKSPTPPPSPVVNPPVFSRPVITNEVTDLVSNDDNDAVSDMVNLSSKMTSLVVEDMDDEQMLQIISNTEDALPSEEKEHQFPSFQACDLNPGTTLVSPFQTHSASIKEDYSPESSAISELPAKDTDDEQMVSHTTNADVLHSKNEECQPTRLQTDDQNKSLNVVSSLPQATSSSIEGNVNSESKSISCDPSPEARSELKDVQMKLLQESVAYLSDDGMQRSETNMSLDVLPITHGDACEINEVDGVAQHQALVSKTTESITLQKPGARETEQFKSPDISSHCQQMRNIINTTEGAWLRDTDSSTQPKTKPSKSLPGDTLGPSTSERTTPTIGESPTPSTKKSPTPPPSPVVNPPVFSRPVITNEVIDLVSNDDNDAVSDMVNLSSKMTSLVVEDMDDEQMLQIISNTEDALPSEEKEHQFPSFQACDLNPGTTLVSPFQTHSASIKEDYSPESSAISELPAKDTDDEQMVSHTTNADVLHSKNEECQPTRLQTDDQNKSLNVVSSLPQATSSSIEGNVNSESKSISCDPSPEARSELKDVQMKLLQESVAYLSDDGMHRSETDISLDVLPISHGDACEINEVDAVAPHQTMVSKTRESSALQISGTIETTQVKSPDIPSLYQVNFNLAFKDSEYGPQTISEKDMSLEELANDGFHLNLDSYCSSATESIGKEHKNHRSLQTSNGVECSVVTDDSNGPCDNRDSFGLGKKKCPAIIVLDEEEENDELIDELDEDRPGGICMSTPKTDRPMAAICFFPRVKLSGRRSTASRRSFFDVVLEEVEDAAREAGTASNVSNDVQYECEEQLTQNYIEEMSEELEEEPSGEMLESESEFSHFYDTDSSRGESFSEVAI